MPPISPLGTAITFIRSMLYALAFYSLTIPLAFIALLVWPFGHRGIGPVADLWARLQRVLAHWILGQRVVIEGVIPAEPHLVVCKHESMFETLDAMCLFHRPVIAAKRELLDIPVWGAAAQSYGLIPVAREGGASALRAIRTAAHAAFAAGRPVIFYPEGTRVAHGDRPPLKAGFAGLYTILKSPVLPIAVNSGRVSPRNSFLKRAGTITYRIGEPIPAGLPRAEAERRVHEAINALNPSLPDSAEDGKRRE